MKFKKWLLQNVHWVTFGLAVVLITTVIILGSDTKARNLQDEMHKLLQEIKNSPRQDSAMQKVPDYLGQIKENWGPVRTWHVNDSPQEYLLYQKSQIQFIKRTYTVQVIREPSDLKTDADRERIKVSWNPPTKVDGENMASVDGFHLQKRWEWKGEKKNQIIALSSETISYEDRDVKQNVVYFYSVRAWTQNPQAQGGEKLAIENKPIVATPYTKEAKAKLLPIYKMRLLGISQIGEEKTAIIEISKWVKDGWRSMTSHFKKDDNIQGKTFFNQIGKVEFKPGWKLKYLNVKHLVVKKEPVKQRVPSESMEDERIIYQIIYKNVYYKNVPMIGYIDENRQKYTLMMEQ